MDMIDFDKMTEEIEQVVNKYGLTIDFGKGTIGQEVEITLKLRKAVKNVFCEECKYLPKCELTKHEEVDTCKKGEKHCAVYVKLNKSYGYDKNQLPIV